MKINSDQLDYIPWQRYIVEIKDNKAGLRFMSKRFYAKKTAISVSCGWNALIGISADLWDTKTGEIIHGSIS